MVKEVTIVVLVFDVQFTACVHDNQHYSHFSSKIIYLSGY